MTLTNFKKATDTTSGGADKYGAQDLKYVFDVLDGTHSTDRLQITNIENFVSAFDVLVYQSDSTVYVRRANGTLLYSATTNSSTNDATAINTAFNVAITDNKPTSVWIKPGTYTTNGTGVVITLVSNLTVFAHGVTVKYLGSASTTYFLFNTSGGFGGVHDVNIFGLTVDCNNLCQGMRFAGSDTSGNQSKNISIQDCTFKNIYKAYLLMFSYSIQNSSNPADLPTAKNRDIGIIRCNFIAGDTTNSDNTIPMVHIINTRGFFIRECIFEGHTSTNQAAVAVSLYSDVGVVANNIFKSNASGEVRDFLLQQARNVVVTSNKFIQKFYIQDCRNITLSGGNRFNHVKIFDKDNASTDDSHPAMFRATRYVLIANNTFDTIPDYDGQNFDNAIELDAGDNDTNSPKHITISGNIVRCRTTFFDISSNLPNGATGGAIEGIMISNNVVCERTSTSANNALLDLTANTTLTDHGLKKVFIIGNYFCAKNPSSPDIQDINLGGTGFTDIVIRKNHFNNEGILNASSYPTTVSRNFGDATTRRDFNSGTVNFSTQSTLSVTHGLQYTPNLQDIYVVPTSSLGGSVGNYWIENVTSTTFDIRTEANSSASFAWRAGRIA